MKNKRTREEEEGGERAVPVVEEKVEIGEQKEQDANFLNLIWISDISGMT